MNSEVEEIKAKLNIVDVLGEYIRLDKAGANWKAACPFHNEKSPSFMVNEERQMWKCFGCQKGGDIFAFVMEMEGVDFREALKILADKAGVELKKYNPKVAEEKNRTLEILELATKFWEHQLWEGPGKIKILAYLRERGLKDETIKKFRLGYAPKGWRNILDFLTKRGYKINEILRTGLLVEKRDAQSSNIQYPISNKIPNANDQNSKQEIQTANYYDRFRERVMFPVAEYSGKVVGFSARVAPGGDESQAKYINTPETEVYHKSRLLYGIDKAKGEIKKNNFTVIVEGNMDVIAAHQAGIENTIAVSGTALTPEQARIMKRYAPKVKMLFDMDAAGQDAAKKSLKICASEDMQVEIVKLPFGKDAADVAREKPEELKKAIEKSENAVEYFLNKSLAENDKDSPEGKRKISEILSDIVLSVANSVEKSHWVRKIAEKLNITEAALTDTLKKASLKERLAKGQAVSKAENSVSAKSKAEMLAEELIGLMFLSEDVWKKAGGSKKEDLEFLKDSLLSEMIKNGDEYKYNFEILLGKLENPNNKARAEKIFLEKKYRQDLNNNFEENIIADPLSEFEKIFREMRRFALKAELEKISQDLKIAEEKKDRDATLYLRQEFHKISKNLSELDEK